VAIDLRPQRAAEAELRQLAAVVSSSNDAIMSKTVDGIVTSWNAAAERLYGYSPLEAIGQHVSFVVPTTKMDELAHILSEIGRGVTVEHLETIRLRKDGSEVPVLLSVCPLVGADGSVTGASTVAHDISERKHLEEALEHRALHDELTGLANRALLIDRLDHALAAARRSKASVGVLFMDLDDFKGVNDTHGHEIGDRLLAKVARRLSRVVRTGDTFARLGGDEFVVVCDRADQVALEALASRLAKALRPPFTIKGHDLAIKASFGLAVSKPSSSRMSLLTEADIDMYKCKTRPDLD